MKVATRFGIGVWIVFLLSLILNQLVAFDALNFGGFRYISIFAVAVAIFGWFLADAKEHGIDPSPVLRISVIALALVAVPYYRFRYMGPKRGFKFIGTVLLGFVTAVVGATTILWLLIGA